MSDPGDEEPHESRVARAHMTYAALEPQVRVEVDLRAQQLAERLCDERGSPRHDYWTRVAGGTLYDVVKAWSAEFGRPLALPPSVSYALAVERFRLDILHVEHKTIMDKVAPRRRDG